MCRCVASRRTRRQRVWLSSAIVCCLTLKVSMYSLHFYGEMLAGGLRTDAHVEALRQAVKPDSVVLDLGCGPGLFALLACRFGARRAFGIETDNVINLAREAAVANGFSYRAEF